MSGPETPRVAALAAVGDLAQVATIRHCETGDSLLDLIEARRVDAAVIGLLDQPGEGLVSLIVQARAQDPDLPIVVDLPATPAAFRTVPEAVQAGASEVSARGYDRLGEIIRTVLSPDWQPGAGPALLDVVPSMVPKSLEPFAIACAVKGSPRLTVELVADWVGTRPRTVRSRLRRASLSSPLAFVRYCSAAHAMCLLYPQGLHPSRVVERMRFGTRRALNDLLQDYTDDSFEPVPKRWAYAALLLRAEEFLRRKRTRRASNVRFVRVLDRYMAGAMTAEEWLRFGQWLARGSPAAESVLQEIRSMWDNPGIGRQSRQRREETWVRLLRSLGSGPEP